MFANRFTHWFLNRFSARLHLVVSIETGLLFAMTLCTPTFVSQEVAGSSLVCPVQQFSLYPLHPIAAKCNCEISCPLHPITAKCASTSLLVPRPLPDFISQPRRKIGRRPGTITTSRTGHGGLGYYVMWTWFRNDGHVPTQYAANTASNRIVKLA